MQAGDAIELAVNLDDRRGLVRRGLRRSSRSSLLAGIDPMLLVPIARLARGLRRAASRLVDAADRRAFARTCPTRRSVMTGRIVDSYTNIQTLKTFAADATRTTTSPTRSTSTRAAVPRADADFTSMWSTLFVLNALLVVGHLDRALPAGTPARCGAATVATAVPFVLQIMNIVGLDPRDRLQRLPAARHRPRLRWRRSRSRYPGRRAGRRDARRDRAARSSSTGSASTTGAASRRGASSDFNLDRPARREGRAGRAARARASRRWSTCCCGSSTSRRARSASTGRTCAR